MDISFAVESMRLLSYVSNEMIVVHIEKLHIKIDTKNTAIEFIVLVMLDKLFGAIRLTLANNEGASIQLNQFLYHYAK